MTPVLECRELRLAYDDTEVLCGVDLKVTPGERVAIIGPSGSGKTSLLYAIAGFVVPRSGEIWLDGAPVSTPGHLVAPEHRALAMVFQQYALWPHMSALETTAFPMLRHGTPPDAARREALELLNDLGVGALAGRRPAALSGGEQQRVGIARALARGARLILLDEPTSHLDAPLRAGLVADLIERQRASGAAAAWATHALSEAQAVADRVAVRAGGRIVQAGTPRALYESPVDLPTARLAGAASVLELDVQGTAGREADVRVGDQVRTIQLESAARLTTGRHRVMVRPDWAELGGGLTASVEAVWYRGAATDYRLATPAGQLELRAPGPPAAAVGDALTWDLRRGWVFGE